MKKEIEKFADKLVNAYKKTKLISPLPIKYTKNIKNRLDKFSSELRFIFITSEATVSDIGQQGNDSAIQGMRVQVKKTNHQKCVRCWHSRPEVGTIKGHESICQRCYDNVKGNGEIRIFA